MLGFLNFVMLSSSTIFVPTLSISPFIYPYSSAEMYSGEILVCMPVLNFCEVPISTKEYNFLIPFSVITIPGIFSYLGISELKIQTIPANNIEKIAIMIKIRFGLVTLTYSSSCSGEDTRSKELFLKRLLFAIITPPICKKLLYK